MSKRRGFTEHELAHAAALRAQGAGFKTIARELGRRCGDGLKRQLDPEYRERRNAYHVDYRFERRIFRRPTKTVVKGSHRINRISLVKMPWDEA